MFQKLSSVLATLVVVSTILFAGAETASAQEGGPVSPPEFATGSRPLGLGGAFTSRGTGLSGLYHNPAGLSTADMYALGGTYEYTPSGNVLNASVIDSIMNPKLAAGIGYSYILGNQEPQSISGHDIRLGMAVPAVPDRLSVGVGGRYLILKRGQTDFARGFTLDAGLNLKLVDGLRIGAAGRNLIDVCRQPERCRGTTPMTIASGLSYGEATDPFLVTGDVEVDLGSSADGVNLNYQAGAEYMAGGVVPLRFGYEHRTLSGNHYLSGGLGWRNQKFGVDLSSRFNLQSPKDVYISASFEMYLRFQQAGRGGGKGRQRRSTVDTDQENSYSSIE